MRVCVCVCVCVCVWQGRFLEEVFLPVMKTREEKLLLFQASDAVVANRMPRDVLTCDTEGTSLGMKGM